MLKTYSQWFAYTDKSGDRHEEVVIKQAKSYLGAELALRTNILAFGDDRGVRTQLIGCPREVEL